MSYNPDIHHRQSIRLKHYNYGQSGSYFITICTQNRICFFGDIIDGQMHLNPAGLVVDKIWHELPNQFMSISIDVFVLMPNHLHGLINIDHKSDKSLHQIIQYFKAISTSQYSFGVKQLNWEPYPGKLWQRNYYEHIVRNENSLNEIRRYIQYNPQEWSIDKENPLNIDYRTNFM
jgi:REP element-mobilizing transposase RayT